MRYTQFGVTIERLKEADIELVRQWRNEPHIVERHEFRDYITPEMQLNWFATVNNLNNFYFIIIYKDEKIGVINVKDINWQTRKLESGIFIPEQRFWNTFVPAVVSVMMTDLFFRVFGWDYFYAHILKSNHQAIQYNKSLGYELCDNQEEVENQLYILRREQFVKKAAKLIKALSVMTGGDSTAIFHLEPEDLGTDIERFSEDNMPESPRVVRIEENDQGRFYYLAD